MSKYIIDLRPDCKVVQQICESDGQVSIGAKSIEYLEELNADYVNEHFGSLQDDAYKRGLENGKKEAESSEAIEQAKADAFNKGMLFKEEKIHDAFLRGLEDAWEAARKVGHCKLWDDYTKDTGKPSVCAVAVLDHYTAYEAIAKLKAYEEKQQTDDEIKVGDEVKPFYTDITGVVTLIDGDTIYVLWRDGSSTSVIKLKEVRKTGRHFDIDKILEDMRHD